MEILKIKGYELEKSAPTTSEDLFNRSEVTVIVDGFEHTFSVLYVRTFFEKLWAEVPFEENPIFRYENHEFQLEDIIALVILIKSLELKDRKRMYINDYDEFASHFKDFNYEKLKDVFIGLIGRGKYFVKAPLDFLV
ncbi:MAG: hypothetical protein K0R71_273 [Bacillales bacterium]|jgi:hypothetical protein|nr:hypothetical protein [Bacillales bacterium]